MRATRLGDRGATAPGALLPGDLWVWRTGRRRFHARVFLDILAPPCANAPRTASRGGRPCSPPRGVRPHARQVARRRRPHRCGGATLLPPFSGRESHSQIHVRRINRREKTDLRLCIRGSLRIRGRLGLRRRPNQGDRGWGPWSQPPRRGKDTRRTRPRALRGPHPASPCAWASPAAAAGPARRGPSAEASQAVNGERTAFPEPVGPRRLQFKIIRGPE